MTRLFVLLIGGFLLLSAEAQGRVCEISSAPGKEYFELIQKAGGQTPVRTSAPASWAQEITALSLAEESMGPNSGGSQVVDIAVLDDGARHQNGVEHLIDREGIKSLRWRDKDESVGWESMEASNADIMNVSYHLGNRKEVYQYFEDELRSGTTLVFSAGNSANQALSTNLQRLLQAEDKLDGSVIVVGSASPFGLASDYSQADEEVSVLAPADYMAQTDFGSGETSSTWGTSFASPLVSKALAQVYEIYPELTAPQAKALVENTALETVESRMNTGQGKGVLNAYKMVEVAKRLASGKYSSDQITKQNSKLYKFDQKSQELFEDAEYQKAFHLNQNHSEALRKLVEQYGDEDPRSQYYRSLDLEVQPDQYLDELEAKYSTDQNVQRMVKRARTANDNETQPGTQTQIAGMSRTRESALEIFRSKENIRNAYQLDENQWFESLRDVGNRPSAQELAYIIDASDMKELENITKEMLQAQRDDIKMVALRALSSLSEGDYVKAIIKMAQHENSDLRSQTLIRLKEPSDRLVRDLAATTEFFDDPIFQERARKDFVQAFKELDEEQYDALASWMQRFRDEDESDQPSLWWFYAQAYMNAAKNEQPAILKEMNQLMRRESPGVYLDEQIEEGREDQDSCRLAEARFRALWELKGEEIDIEELYESWPEACDEPEWLTELIRSKN